MKKARFDHRKLMALCVVMALTLVQNAIGFSPARSAASTLSGDEPNLSSEARTVDSFNDDLLSYDAKRVQLSKKPSLTTEEFNALERNGNDLKRRISQLKDAAESVVRKLKASGRWDNLDEVVVAKLTDSKDRSFVRDNGGLRRVLENAIADLNSQTGDEIVAPLGQLRTKVSQNKGYSIDGSQMSLRFVATSYSPATAHNSEAPLLMRSIRCIGATIRYGVALVVTGISPDTGLSNSKKANNAFICHCIDDCSSSAPLN